MTADVGCAIEWISLVGSSVISTWVVPALIFGLVIIASWIGIRWVQSEHLDALAAVPLFSGLPRKRLMSILRSTHKVEFPPGAKIVEQGAAGGGFFVITRGKAKVAVEGTERTVLSKGAYFGEIAVIDGGPRSATISAATAVTTLELTPSAFKSLIQKEPSIEQTISEELRRRVGASPVDNDATTLSDLCRQLRRAENPDWDQPANVSRRGLRRLFPSRAS